MKYCDTLVRQIERIAYRGVSTKKLCAAVGINQDTYYDWVKKEPFDIYECECVIVNKNEVGKEEYKKSYSKLDSSFPENEENKCPKCKTILEKKSNFSERVIRARANGQIYLINQVYNAAKIDWRAAIEMLRSQYPEEFSRSPRFTPKSDGTDKQYLALEDWKAQKKKELDGSPRDSDA